MKKKKLSIICGTRPQLIKLNALLPTIQKDFQISLINTAQHYSKELTKHFNPAEFPNISYLKCTEPKGEPEEQIAKMLISINKALSKNSLPDAVIVIGDTNSTLAGAIATAKLSLPLIHVEAGVRCFDLRLSEEQNRLVADSLSSLLLCPTQKCLGNLKSSGYSGKSIFSGDLLLDLFLSSSLAISKMDKIEAVLKKINCPSIEYGLFSLHRAENTYDKKNLNQILKALKESDLNFIFLVHPRIKDLIKEVKIPPNVICSKPLSYSETLSLQKNAKLILTDSGGITREAYFSGVPVGVLRDSFEWSEILGEQSNKLLSTDYHKIKDFLETPKEKYLANLKLFGSGKAANIISQEIKNFL